MEKEFYFALSWMNGFHESAASFTSPVYMGFKGEPIPLIQIHQFPLRWDWCGGQICASKFGLCSPHPITREMVQNVNQLVIQRMLWARHYWLSDLCWEKKRLWQHEGQQLQFTLTNSHWQTFLTVFVYIFLLVQIWGWEIKMFVQKKP